MAKKSMIAREKKRQKLVERYAAKRAELKEIANDESKPMEERFKARPLVPFRDKVSGLLNQLKR